MAYDFPASPSENQEYTPAGGPTYVYKAPRWMVKAVPAGLQISDTPPTSPANGSMWWESDTGNLFVYYNDGNTSQWVQVNAAPANMPPVPPSDGGEYTMVNGVWRLKSQTFYPTGTGGQIITVPTTAKLAKITAKLYATAAAYVMLRVSVDGTTFIAGATDYNTGGIISYSGSSASPVKYAYVAASSFILCPTSDVVNVPIQIEANLMVGKGAAPQCFGMQWRGEAYNTSGTIYLCEYINTGFIPQPTVTALTQLPAFQIIPSANGWAAGSTISVDWVY